MVTGDLKSKIDRIWDAFWSGGIANPLEVIEQITYLLFLRRLDELHTLEENKANRLNRPMERHIFPEGADAKGRDYADMRWSRFKDFAPSEMYTVVGEHVFPFLRTLGGDGSTYAHHMRDARFTIPTPALLVKVVDMLDDVPMADRDTKGDVYEYMLGKIASAGQNGQFRTPRHIIRLMVELTAPQPDDVICDPASGTCGFLVAAGEYLREQHSGLLHSKSHRDHFNNEQKVFLGALTDDQWWTDVTLPMLEQARRRVRGLVKLLEPQNRKVVYTDFEDELGELTTVEVTAESRQIDGPRFRAKVLAFLRRHENHIALQKLRRNIALTESDLAELERMLIESGDVDEGALRESIERAHGLGMFVRSLIGLDRSAAEEALSRFLMDTTMTSSQIEFLHMIVDRLAGDGVVEAAALYEPPFTHIAPTGPDQIFTNERIADIEVALEHVRASAMAS